MKKKELKELETKSISELNQMIKEAGLELLKLKMEKGAGKLKDTQAVNKKRRKLAWLKTILKEKELKEGS